MCFPPEKCFTRRAEQSYCKRNYSQTGLMSTVGLNSAYNFNRSCTRRARTRKFNLNMYWYKNLYRHQRNLEHFWTLHHNPLEGKNISGPFNHNNPLKGSNTSGPLTTTPWKVGTLPDPSSQPPGR